MEASRHSHGSFQHFVKVLFLNEIIITACATQNAAVMDSYSGIIMVFIFFSTFFLIISHFLVGCGFLGQP